MNSPVNSERGSNDSAPATEKSADAVKDNRRKETDPEQPEVPSSHPGSETLINVVPKSCDGAFTEEVAIAQIRDDEGTQTRVSIDEAIVAEYSELMNEEGNRFPPIDLFQEGDFYWVGDGFHRLRARKKMGCKKIEANVRPGGRIEALRHSLSANSKHGLQRTHADKRKAVHIALKEFADLSSRNIAELCGVGRQLVEGVRRQLDESASSKSRVGKDGKKRRPPQKSASKDAKKNAKAGAVASSKNAKTSANTEDPKARSNYAGDEKNTDPAASQPPPSQGGDLGPPLFTFTNGHILRSSEWPAGWISGAQIATKLMAVTNCAQNAVSNKLTNEELLERQKAVESCGRWANQLGGVEPGKKRIEDIQQAFCQIGNLIAEGLHKLNLPPPTSPGEEDEYSGPDIS